MSTPTTKRLMGKATPFWKKGVFCVRLNIEPKDRKTQEIADGGRRLPLSERSETSPTDFPFHSKSVGVSAVKKMKTADSWGKLGLTLYDGEYYQKALIAFRKVVEFEPKSIWGFAARVWQGHLLDLLNCRDEAVEQYRIAQEMGNVGTMRHDQYGLVINQEWVEARLQTPFQCEGGYHHTHQLKGE